MSNFPPLRLAVLTGLANIKDQLESNAEILEQPDCPYDNETKQLLKSLLAPKVVETIVTREGPAAKAARGRPSKDIQLSEEDQQLIVTEISELIEALKEMGTGEGLSTPERIAITNNKAKLVSELLRMRERNNTVVKMEQFKEVVIGILNDLVSESDREIFMARLEPYR